MAPTVRHPSVDPPGVGGLSTSLIDAAAAVRVVRAAASEPPAAETIALFLDDTHCGSTCCVVTGTTEADDVLEVAALMAESAGPSATVHAVVLASVRPRRVAAAVLEGDIERWLALLDLFDEVGVELLDWFVVGPGPGVRSMRHETGMPSLWRGA